MIFTDRKITIRNGKSTINEPVILYRGDYEVSIRFTIMESKFRFKSGVNLVDSEKASHGQLAILTPYGGNVFSEIVKCEDGTVTFTLTKEMIDQLEEVGLYSFQIRLFDYYRESRVSIPPVEFGIEVREPVASEDHDNTVNNAIVGYSIAKVVDPSKENVGPTFDDRGNYNKTDWETGDRITEGKLNKIEDALDKINQNEINDKNALNKRITSNFNVMQDQIDNLVLESGGDSNLEVVQARGIFNILNDRLNVNDDINKLNISKTKLVQNVKLQHCMKNDGTVTPVSPSYALTYYDVTNLEYICIEGNLNVPNGSYSDYLFKDVNGNVLEYQGKKNSTLSNIFKVPTGATILYLGTGASDYMYMSVYNVNNMQDVIEDLKIISLNKMDDSTLETFNKSSYMEKLTPVIYQQNCVKNDGTITPVTPSYTSLEFDVQNESYIYVKNLNVSAPNSGYCYYVIINKSNEVLESVTGSKETLNKLIHLPNDSYKIRFTCLASNYGEGSVLIYRNITDVINTKSSYEYVDNSINNLNNLYEVENLFDKYSDEVVLGYNLGSDGILYESPNQFVTNYIPVTVDDTLYANFINGAYYVCYNSEKKRIGYGYLSSGTSGYSKISELTTVNSDNLPAIAYIRFSNPVANIDKLTVNLAPVYKSQAHKVLPVKHLQGTNNGLINFWEGKTGDSLGDSLTGQGFFQKYTSMYFNLRRFANHGVGGSKLSGADVDSSRLSMWKDERINALRDDADFITILGGQNDGDIEIGEVSKTNVDTNTYVGAYNTIIDKIYKKYNGNIQIILCTPFYVPSEGDDGERFIKLDKAVKEIGQLHGLPVADFGGMSGANKYVKDIYWTSGDRTHPIEDFYRDKITPILVETMQKVKPIDFEKINSIDYGVTQ